MKTGIAGDKYFEVLAGLKEGDKVVVGPFNSVRNLADGDCNQGGGGHTDTAAMNKFLDAMGVALSSVWTNKLRSFMMVLGNVVAVTSIIAVVSLIRGMDSYVSNAIVGEVGAGTFQVERVGFVTNEEDEQRARRRNPIITLADMRAISEFSENISAVMAEMGSGANISFGETTLESTRIRGVSADYAEFSGFTAAIGRIPSRFEVERSRPVVLLGWDTAENLFKGRNPIDQVVMIRGMHFRVVGVAEKKGSVFGNSQDEFAIIPLGAFYKLFGARWSLSLSVKPTDPSVMPTAMEDTRVALRIPPPSGTEGRRQLRHAQLTNANRFLAQLLPGNLCGTSGHRLAVARRRRHRHHEHHADGRQRADARDWTA